MNVVRPVLNKEPIKPLTVPSDHTRVGSLSDGGFSFPLQFIYLVFSKSLKAANSSRSRGSVCAPCWPGGNLLVLPSLALGSQLASLHVSSVTHLAMSPNTLAREERRAGDNSCCAVRRSF